MRKKSKSKRGGGGGPWNALRMHRRIRGKVEPRFLRRTKTVFFFFFFFSFFLYLVTTRELAFLSLSPREFLLEQMDSRSRWGKRRPIAPRLSATVVVSLWKALKITEEL